MKPEMARYKLDTKALTFEKFDDELIVINLARGTYSSLTGSAPAIFDLLAEARVLRTLHGFLASIRTNHPSE